MNKPYKYITNIIPITLSVIAVIGVILIFVKIEKIGNKQQKQNQLIYQKSKKEETIQTTSQQPPIPEIKPYFITLYDNRAEPNGYVVRKGDSVEITVTNKSSKEIDFLIEELNISAQIKPNETKKFKAIIPEVSNGRQIEWKTNGTTLKTLGMFIVQ